MAANMVTYEKSNKVVEVRLKSFKKDITNKLLNCGDDAIKREKIAQDLMNYLCDKFKIDRVKVAVLDVTQRQLYNGHVCGDYNRCLMKIRIYNLTAKRAKVVSIKGFYDTLLHEFMHHYDLKVLKMSDTPHTSGFYKRISDLKEKLNS